MARDWVKDIVRNIAAGELKRIGDIGHKALAQIDVEIRNLQVQAALIRNLLNYYVSREEDAVGVDPLAVADGGKLPADGLTGRQRSNLVRDAALTLARQGRQRLTVGDVLTELQQRNISFSVRRPGSMIGTVLTFMPEFQRTGPNAFDYIGDGNIAQLGPRHRDENQK